MKPEPSANDVGTSILTLIGTLEAAGTQPADVLAGVSAACLFTLTRYGAAEALPRILRNEASRLERMDLLDRGARNLIQD
ncbi:hypothetical protein [Sphingomonas beigongshangi]|uniref:hypothetical protein n=1 Tax=Sphingomonas beigongshangi TaxID=2782540 RepID=UPI00193BF6BF|nr:hypothetical protein [Sphingomonas beigongshangi]